MILIAASINPSVLGSADMEMMIWNLVLTTLVAVLSFFMKAKFEALDRVTILLNKTREEIAREHVTRAEMNVIVDKLGERFDRSFERLESKLDEMRKV